MSKKFLEVEKVEKCQKMLKKLKNVEKVEKCQKMLKKLKNVKKCRKSLKIGWLVFEVHGSLLMSGRNLESIGFIEPEI